tara:strand:+ start:195 stop:476 length:282 start_codon:yes stop_codon:yes gene_type:complete
MAQIRFLALLPPWVVDEGANGLTVLLEALEVGLRVLTQAVLERMVKVMLVGMVQVLLPTNQAAAAQAQLAATLTHLLLALVETGHPRPYQVRV